MVTELKRHKNDRESYVFVNDTHSKLNRTLVARVFKPTSEYDLKRIISMAKGTDQQIAISGGKHAMGGQQFKSRGFLIDTREMKRVLRFDGARGLLTVEAGIQWTELVAQLRELQSAAPSSTKRWSIRQKQTGCDDLTIGGALAANIHGRGLQLKPFVDDIEDFRITLANGKTYYCSRETNRELFSLVIGGYGAFGIVSTATLRLVAGLNYRRHVKLSFVETLNDDFQSAINDGAKYGDFQFSIDSSEPEFLKRGIFSTYTPTDSGDSPIESLAEQKDLKQLGVKDWLELSRLAHVDKKLAFEKYCRHYLSTDGQVYAGDEFQMSTYIPDYHHLIGKDLVLPESGSEMITELYVPRHRLERFMKHAAEALRAAGASVIYGTVRLIEADDQTFLAWARSAWACVVLNLHVEHTASSIEQAKEVFRRLIEIASDLDGSYYLTYHRFAKREQLLRCYPQFPQFFRQKDKYDPNDLFHSDWLEQCRMLIDESASGAA